jgi:uncharacterized coiled-coil protein SlyX
MADDQLTAAEQIARLYEQAEAAAADASERLVGSGGFAALLGQLAENVAVISKASGDALDAAVHNLRVAGRQDVIRLERQLARTEDKLERVLQEIEVLQERLDASEKSAAQKPARQPKPRKPAAERDA